MGLLWAGCLRPNPDFGEVASATVASDASSSGGVTGSATGGSATAECPTHPNLVVCYPFPPGVTDVLADGSGSEVHGAMKKVTLVDGLMDHGKAARVEVDGEITAGDHPVFRPQFFTLSVLVYPEGDGYIFDYENHIGLQLVGSKVSCQVINDDDEYPIASVGIGLSQWSHVGCSFDGHEVRVWVEDMAGPEESSISLGGILKSSAGSGVAVGMNSPELDQRLSGLIDDVLFFNAALTREELCAFHPFC